MAVGWVTEMVPMNSILMALAQRISVIYLIIYLADLEVLVQALEALVLAVQALEAPALAAQALEAPALVVLAEPAGAALMEQAGREQMPRLILQ